MANYEPAPRNIVYSYEDVPTIAAFAASNARIRGILGPFRSGKSSGSVMEIIRRGCAQAPGLDGVRRSRWIVVRNTFAQLEDSTIRTVMMWLPPERFGKYTQDKHNYLVKGLRGEGDHPTEIEIWFRALDRPDHVRNLLSVEVTGGWVNEAREIPWSIVEALDGRIGMYPSRAMGPLTWAGLWLDTNPPDTDSRWYKFFEERPWLKDFPKLIEAGVLPPGSKPEDYAQIFRQPDGLGPLAENISNLPSRTYYHTLAIGKSEAWVKIYIKGLYGYVNEGKAVYPEYVDAVHCQPVDPIPGLPIIRGWDYGLTPACTFHQELPSGQWLTFDELVSENMSIDQFSNDVIAHCARSFRPERRGEAVKFRDVGDPAGEQRSQTDKTTCFEIQRSKGINVQPGPQSPSLRQESVRWLLRQKMNESWDPMFILHPRCKVLRKGFQGGYHRRKLKVAGSERYSDEPEKNEYSHPHDSAQYVIADRFGAILTQRDYDEESEAWQDSVPGAGGMSGDRDEITGY